MKRLRRWVYALGAVSLGVVVLAALATVAAGDAKAGALGALCCRLGLCKYNCPGHVGPTFVEEWGGSWFWMRSPEEEKRFIANLYTRYCIRCHGVDGRGVWDIPCVPDFTNPRWQASRTDGEIARIIIEGRGAVMPPFRGAITLEEAWAMARYLRTFPPGCEEGKPDLGNDKDKKDGDKDKKDGDKDKKDGDKDKKDGDKTQTKDGENPKK
jgi:hypothetical protein